MSIESLCELDKRQSVLNRARILEKLRKSTLASLEDGQLLEVILNQADEKNEEWACNKCKFVNKPVVPPSSSSSSSNKTAAELTAEANAAAKCAQCSACKIHGTITCVEWSVCVLCLKC